MDVILGTKLKLNLHIDKYDDMSMSDYDFDVEVFSSKGTNSMMYKKADMIKIDDDNYCLLVDTAIIGLGKIKLKVHAYIPDNDFVGGVRDEIDIVDTRLVVI